MASKRLANQADGAGIDAVGRPAVRGATDRVREPPRLAQRPHERAALRVDVRRVGAAQVLVRPAIQLDREGAVPRLQKGPLQVRTVGHCQLPSKRGFRFSTKA